MNYKIKIEGQEIEMPEEIAGDDAALKSALAPFFPGAANAKFMRSEEKDGVIIVTVVKQAGTKGAGDDEEWHLIAITKGEHRRLTLGLPDYEVTHSKLVASLPVGLEDQVLRKLINAPEGINPVVEMHRSLEGKTLNQMTVDQLMDLDDQIDKIIQSGLQEKSAIESSLALITNINPIPSKVVVAGF